MSRIRSSAILLLLLLIVIGAGCTGDPGTSVTDSTTVETTSPVQTPSRSTTSTSQVTTTTIVTTPQPDNPWKSDTLVVGVKKESNDTRNYKPLVRKAIEFWNNDSITHSPYNVTFLLVNNTESQDVVVNFTEGHIPTTTISIGDTLGSAPLVKPGDRVHSTSMIYIKAGYNNTSTIQTIKHEFGHYLGLEHGDEPMPLMAEYGAASRLPTPNATERPIAWESTNISVLTSVHNMQDSEVNSQIEHALNYYESGAEGWMESNVTFYMVSNESDADIVIEVYNSDTNSDLLVDEGSIGSVYGIDPDDDQALEYYTSARIIVGGIEEDAVGWHVGSWIAYSLGGEDLEDVPSPFDNADYDDRRDEWWE